jgi:hypothetical protein
MDETKEEEVIDTCHRTLATAAEMHIPRRAAIKVLEEYQFGQKISKKDAKTRGESLLEDSSLLDEPGFTLKQFKAMIDATPPMGTLAGSSLSSSKKENKWFSKINLIQQSQLKEGDILMQKSYDGHKSPLRKPWLSERRRFMDQSILFMLPYTVWVGSAIMRIKGG